ncbi:MAG TPA: twin transmembrane helix small protein [Rhodopila sp.]|jgi:hypothetical protein|nr:twin transmembrane helix small protein [Rhodopila sp.]
MDMHSFLTLLVALCMFATLGVLIAGLVQMMWSPDGRRSNKLMQWRVLLQGTAILLFVIMMSLLHS